MAVAATTFSTMLAIHRPMLRLIRPISRLLQLDDASHRRARLRRKRRSQSLFQRGFARAKRFLAISLLAASLQGCTAWETVQTSETTLLPQTRMSRDTVVLEMQTLAIPDSTTSEESEELWRQLDEQHLDRDLRRRLAENGFRSGLLGTHVPAPLRNLLDAQSTTSEKRWEQLESARENSLGHRRLQARAHHRYEIVSSPTRDSCVVLKSLDGSLTGETLFNAQCRFGLRAHPRGDGDVRIELTPEIHHGPLEQKWTGNDGAFQPLVSRRKETFDDLKIDTVLGPGDVLLLTCTDVPKGIGELFFLDDGPTAPKQGDVLLIRVAQTQQDDLFAEEVIETSIATSERNHE